MCLKTRGLPPVFTLNGVELKAERRKPSGEKYFEFDEIASLTGAIEHFRLY